MKEVISFLNENPAGFLATTNEGEPRVRPWGFMYEENGRFFFCTNNTKEAYRQLMKTPFIEFASLNKNMVWVRLRGKITFTEDRKVKERIIEGNSLVKSIYQTPDNPIFKAFYIEHGSASIADFSGQPPKIYTF
jgi:uncharacterized pyridoxamine 5'-phosphate oxidase family protein